MVSERRLGTIQFEFNEMNTVGGTFLDQFFTALAATHDLYRLLPHGLVQLHHGSHWFNGISVRTPENAFGIETFPFGTVISTSLRNG